MIVKSLTNVFWKFAAVFGGVDKRGAQTGRSALPGCMRQIIFCWTGRKNKIAALKTNVSGAAAVRLVLLLCLVRVRRFRRCFEIRL